MTTVSSEAAISVDVYCPRCGYNLRGLTGGICPECGDDVSAVRSARSVIPWTYRKAKSEARRPFRLAPTASLMFVKTAWMAMFARRRLCVEISREASFADARAFRRWVVGLAWLPFLGAGALLVLNCLAGTWRRATWIDDIAREIWPVAVLVVGALLGLAAMTGLPSYWFHPKDTPVRFQNRAIALSYYACAPLAFFVVPSALQATAQLFSSVERVSILASGLAIAVTLFVLFEWWYGVVAMLRILMPQHRRRMWSAALLLPLLWPLVFVLCVAWVCLLVFYPVYVWSSLS